MSKGTGERFVLASIRTLCKGTSSKAAAQHHSRRVTAQRNEPYSTWSFALLSPSGVYVLREIVHLTIEFRS